MVLGPARCFPWLRTGISAGSSVAQSSLDFFLCRQGTSVWKVEQFNIAPLTFEKSYTILLDEKSNEMYASCNNGAKVFFLELTNCSVCTIFKLYSPKLSLVTSKTSKLHTKFEILHTAYCASQGNNTFNNCSWSNVSSLTAISNSSKGSVSSFFEENQHIIKHHQKQQKSLHTFCIVALKAMNVSCFIDEDTSDILWLRWSVFKRQHRHLKA